jgi:competence protein ComFC
MNDLLRIILDTLFPPTAHERRLRHCTADSFSHLLRPTAVGTHTALAHYDNEIIKAAVAACKFENNTKAAKLLSLLIEKWLHTNTTTGTTILIPIPLSSARIKERGFNQVERVVSHIPPATECIVAPKLLSRIRDTARQTSLGRAERLQNMKEVFTVNVHQLELIDWSAVSRVIVCDDVLTTGATLSAAKAALAPHLPTNVTLATLAWAH